MGLRVADLELHVQPVLLFVGLIKATDADGIEGLILESE